MLEKKHDSAGLLLGCLSGELECFVRVARGPGSLVLESSFANEAVDCWGDDLWVGSRLLHFGF